MTTRVKSKDVDLKSEEYRKLFKELKSSEHTLAELYDDSHTATLKFKSAFNNIRELENETEMKREKYYDMLAAQAYNEALRDEYFENEKVLRDKKDLYIEQSQKLAHTNSQYVVFSDEYSAQRESCIKKMLVDIDKQYAACERMTKERDGYMQKSAELKEQSDNFKIDIKELKQIKKELEERNENLSEECDKFHQLSDDLTIERDDLLKLKNELESSITSLTSTNDDLTKDRNKYKKSTERLSKEVEGHKAEEKKLNLNVTNLKNEKTNLENDIRMYQDETAKLKRERDNLIRKTRELTAKIEISRQTLNETEKQREIFKEAFDKAKHDKEVMEEQYEKMKKEKEKFKGENKDLSKELKEYHAKRDRFIFQTSRTNERNMDLITAHKILTKELEDIKIKLRNTNERAQKDVQLRHELREAIKRLKRELEEEKRKQIKDTRVGKTQTDESLASESRDIFVQHAQVKMKQALRARDRSAKEKEKVILERQRDANALKESVRQLDLAKLHEKRMTEKHNRMSLKLEDTTRLLNAAKKEIAKEKNRMLREERVKKKTNDIILQLEQELAKSRQVPLQHNASQQTNEVIILDTDEGGLVYEHAKKLEKSVEEMKSNMTGLREEITHTNRSKESLSREIMREKSANGILRDKVVHIEGRYIEERNYVRAVRKAAINNNIPFATIPTPPSHEYVGNGDELIYDDAKNYESETTLEWKKESNEDARKEDVTDDELNFANTPEVRVQTRVSVPLSPRSNPLEGTSAGLLKRPLSDSASGGRQIAKRIHDNRSMNTTSTTVTPLNFDPSSPRLINMKMAQSPYVTTLPKSTKLYLQQTVV